MLQLNNIPNIQKGEANFSQMVAATSFNKMMHDRQPDMMVTPRSVQEIITTLNFAKAVNKKISVCSGGHSWSQNHLRNDSILINMKGFNQCEIDSQNKTAKAGPGVGGSVLLLAALGKGLFFPAGHCKGVCIGGYLLQGGFGWNGRKLGMACENVIGIDLVTPDGRFIHANERENADWFWAARGSGGGFFGIVVSFHLRLYDRPKHIGMVSQVYGIKHLDEVFSWAHQVGPSVPNSVEFQILMTKKTLGFFGAGMEVVAPVFADTKRELEEATAFISDSPIRNKAYFRTPFMPLTVKMMYDMVMSHYPSEHHWGVDNLWTKASMDELLPHLHKIADTMPNAPSHMLWLNWFPPVQRTDMAFSIEDNIYIALYGCWKDAANTPLLENWAKDRVCEMEHLATGIQLADEGLHRRTARFLCDENLERLDIIRATQDPDNQFNAWHSRPNLTPTISTALKSKEEGEHIVYTM